jgi:glycosyltransferase involved in cell wall biosynthesis
MENPKISIILPVHNGGDYLRAALNSVFAQTYPNFELIVLENASEDDTVAILNSYHDPRLTVIPSAEFLSIERNWARISAITLSSYITFLSHDDRLLPEFLATCVKLIAKHPDASVYTTHFHLIGHNDKFLRLCKAVPYTENAEAFLRAMQLHQRDSFGTGYVVRRDDFLNVGGFPPLAGMMFADDLLFYWITKYGYKICDPEIHFEYRYHVSSAARSSNLMLIQQAGIGYLELLEADGYSQKPENRRIAENYVQTILVRQHRALLANLNASADTLGIQQYHQTIAELSQDSRWWGSDDVFVRILQFLLSCPLSLRGFLMRFIRLVARLTWQFRNRRSVSS